MPDAWVLSNTTSNFSRDGVGDDGFLTEVKVTVGYDTPGIATTPAPFIVHSALSDFYIEYRLCAHAPEETPRGRAVVRNRLHQAVLDVFDANEVRLTSPHLPMWR